MVDNKTVGERIKSLRKSKRLTVAECCEAVQVSPSAWRSYENGDRIPRDEKKVLIANYFKKSVASIFFND